MRILFLCCAIAFSVGVLLAIATTMQTSSNTTINYQRFAAMLKQHDVQKVVTNKSGDLLMAEVFLTPDALANKADQYRDAKRDNSQFSLSDGTVPQYVFQSSAYDWLFKQINDTETAWGWTDAQKIPITIVPGHESMFSNWFVQCVIMLFLLLFPVLCGYLGFTEGKNRAIGSTAGLLLGISLASLGL